MLCILKLLANIYCTLKFTYMGGKDIINYFYVWLEEIAFSDKMARLISFQLASNLFWWPIKSLSIYPSNLWKFPERYNMAVFKIGVIRFLRSHLGEQRFVNLNVPH